MPARRLGEYVNGTFAFDGLADAEDAVSDLLGGSTSGLGRVVRGAAATLAGVDPTLVARCLGWSEFESFCAAILRAKGCGVRENLRLTKPRAQIDLLAESAGAAMAVDCKRWKREMGEASLARVVAAQAERAERLRERMPSLPPLYVVVVLMANESPRFVAGGAVVPVFSLPSFVDNLGSYAGFLDAY